MNKSDERHHSHFDMESMIQDHGGGTHTDSVLAAQQKLVPDCAIHVPPFASSGMEHSDWVLPYNHDEDLVDQLMEENQTLRKQMEIVQGKLSEAVSANEQWYQHNEKTELQMTDMKHIIEELEEQISHERTKHEKTKKALEKVNHSGVNTMGISGKQASADLVNRNTWLEKETCFLREQLNKVQSKLRKMEMRETGGVPADWTCDRCTLLNPADAGKCVACGDEAPSKYVFMSGTLECDGPLGFCY